MDVLGSDGLTVSNVTATYDSAFTNNLYPGWRFPSASYKNVNVPEHHFDGLRCQHHSRADRQRRMANQALVFSNVKVVMKNWVAASAPFPAIAGLTNTVSLNYSMQQTQSLHMKAQSETVELELKASVATMKVGQTTDLTWLSRGGNSCSGSGAWSGSFGTNGMRAIKITTAGTYNFTLDCRNAGSTSSTTLSVVVSS